MKEFQDAQKLVEDRMRSAFFRLKTSSKDSKVSEIESSVQSFIRDCFDGESPLEVMQGRLVRIIRSLQGVDSPSNHDYLSMAFELLKLKFKKSGDDSQKLNLMQPRLLDSQLGKQQFRTDDSISESVEEQADAWKREVKKIEDSPEEIQKIVDTVDDLEDIADEYSEDELILDEEVIDESLSRAARLQKRISFNKTKAKRERAKSIALKKLSTQSGLEKKARRLAIKLLKEKIAKKPMSKLSVQEKERLEKIVSGSKDLIRRLSTKLATRIRKIEQSRVSRTKISEATLASNIKSTTNFDTEPEQFDINHVRKHGMIDLDGDRPAEMNLGKVNGLNISLIRERDSENGHVVSHDEQGRIHHVIELRHEPGYHIGAIQEGTIFKNHSIPKEEQKAKMSDIYAHLIKRGHMIVSDDLHSTGGIKVWQELSRHPHVDVFGWDPDTDTPINTEKHLQDISDTHFDFKKMDSFHAGDPDYQHERKRINFRLIASPKNGKIRTSISEAMESRIRKGEDVGLGYVWIDGIHSFRDYASLHSKEHDLGKLGNHTNVSQFEENTSDGKKRGFFVTHDRNGDIHHAIQYHTQSPTEPRTLVIDALAKNPKAHHEMKAHDLYHHLVTNHGFKIMSDSSVSPGAKKVWDRLSEMPGVNVENLDSYGKNHYSFVASKV